jgi:methyl-accepting chemotaxis protein
MLDRIKLDRFDLRAKLIIAFLLVGMLVGVTGLVGYTSVSSVDAQLESVVHDDVAEADAAMEMKFDLESERLALHEVLTGELEAADEFRASQAEFEEWYTTLAERDDLTEEQQQLLAEMKTEHETAKTTGEEVIAAMEAGNEEHANEKMDELDSVYVELEEDTTSFEEDADAKMEASVASAATTTDNSHMMIIGLTIAAFIAAIVIGLFVASRLTTPIKQLSAASQAMSEGDLTAEVTDHIEDDELGRMSDAFQQMQANLRRVFDEIDTFSTNLATGDDALQTRDRQTDFPGTYGDITTNLDNGATEMVGGFEEIRTASQNLKNGSLDQDIDTDRAGNYGEILTTFNDGMGALSGSFDEIATASEDLKEGRLDQNLDTEYPGTYGTVLVNLEDGIDQLSASIASVQQIADDVATSSEETTASVEETETASDEIATSVEEISAGAENQSERLQEVSGEMNDMSATVEEIASSAEEVAATASTAVERSEAGRESSTDASAELDSIKAQADGAAEQVQQLDAKMNEIGEVVEMITEIAEQTNMLALNASIEAARAGEAGEGFGVVANEIKGLAEEAADATTTIEERIEDVQETTDSTVGEIDDMRATVESGAETIEDAVEMFDDIANAVQEAEGGIQEISDATDDQAASTEEAVSMVDEVSSVSQQTAAEASNVSAATEEQAASLSEASEALQEMASLADELNTQTATFEVGTTDGHSQTATTGSLPARAVSDGGNVSEADREGDQYQ